MRNNNVNDTKFGLGYITVTLKIAADMDEYSTFKEEIFQCVSMHSSGDWGIVCDEDKQINDDAVRNGGRILSAYETSRGKIWIITESDRTVTTVLFPHEY